MWASIRHNRIPQRTRKVRTRGQGTPKQRSLMTWMQVSEWPKKNGDYDPWRARQIILEGFIVGFPILSY